MLRRICLAAALTVTGLIAVPTIAGAATVYNDIPAPLPGNVTSEAYQATQTAEFGGQVGLAGTDRQDPTITVTMSSWGCGTSGTWNNNNCVTTTGATFPQPLTLNIYSVLPNGEPGGLISSVTNTFNIPFRPTADPTCLGADLGKWKDSTGACNNGIAHNVVYNLAGRGVSLPDRAIISIAFDTTSYGQNPHGIGAACFATSQGCAYDSLNMGLNSHGGIPGPAPSVGTTPRPEDAYVNYAPGFGGNYCDGGTGGVGTFRLDNCTPGPGDWTGFQPAISIDATPGPTGPAGANGAAGAAGAVQGVTAKSCKKPKKLNKKTGKCVKKKKKK
jgi:hypothetical protein